MNHPTSRHDSGKGFGSLLVLLLIAVIFILYKTWRWWLIILLVLGVIALVKRRKLVWISLTRREVEPAVDSFRRGAMEWLFSFGLLTAIICAVEVGREDLQWYLIPILLLAAAIRLRGLGGSNYRFMIVSRQP